MGCRGSPTCGRSPNAKAARCRTSSTAKPVQPKPPDCDSRLAAKPFQGPSLFQTNRPPQNLHGRHRGTESVAGENGKRNRAAVCARRAFWGRRAGADGNSRGIKAAKKSTRPKNGILQGRRRSRSRRPKRRASRKGGLSKKPGRLVGQQGGGKTKRPKRQTAGIRPPLRPQHGPAQKRRRLCQNAV